MVVEQVQMLPMMDTSTMYIEKWVHQLEFGLDVMINCLAKSEGDFQTLDSFSQ